MNSFTKWLGGTSAVVALALGMSTASGALLTYEFTGECTIDCTGTATGTLVLQDYTPGTDLGDQHFVSFTYSSSFFPADLVVGVPQELLLAGSLPATPGSALMTLVWIDGTNIYTFTTCDASPQCDARSDQVGAPPDGTWSLVEQDLGTQDEGIGGQWAIASAAVPIPGSAALLALALAGLGFSRRRAAC